MKDIDFDELDRAVGTVLGADATAPEDAHSDAVTVETKPVEPAVTPVAPTKPDEPTSSVTPTIKTATSPARKRGQFLDMVHPSADMRGSKTTLPTGPRKTLAPLNPSVAPSSPEETKPAVAEVSAPEEPATPPVSVPEPDAAEATTSAATHDGIDEPRDLGYAAQAENEHNAEVSAPEVTQSDEPAWPDPLDVATDDKTSDDTRAAESESASDGTGEPVSQTPFVPGVEVEKRPLGGGPSVDPPAPLSPLTSPDVTEDSSEGASPESQVAASPSDLTGPEMSEEINSVESNGVKESQTPGDTASLQTAPQESATPAPETPVEEPKPEVKAAPVVPDAPVGAQSIPQQYKPSEKAKDDDEDHPLFDTEEYHQPLLPTGKKKAGKSILLIVLFVVLVLVGCALGYLAFNMGL